MKWLLEAIKAEWAKWVDIRAARALRGHVLKPLKQVKREADRYRP